MTNMVTMPIYGKNLKNASSPEPIDQWPWNLVCSFFYASTTKVVQIMTLDWPWPILHQGQIWLHRLLYGRKWIFFFFWKLSHLGMFVTTGCSSRRQFVATASRQDTGSRQQNTDSGRQVTASGQFYKPSQTQESKYSSYALLLLCRLKWKNGSTFNERNFM